jgi:hypothetical protein
LIVILPLNDPISEAKLQYESGRWEPTGDHFVWRVHTGQNRLAVRTVNKFNVVGPVSAAEAVIAP